MGKGSVHGSNRQQTHIRNSKDRASSLPQLHFRFYHFTQGFLHSSSNKIYRRYGDNLSIRMHAPVCVSPIISTMQLRMLKEHNSLSTLCIVECVLLIECINFEMSCRNLKASKNNMHSPPCSSFFTDQVTEREFVYRGLLRAVELAVMNAHRIIYL